MTLELIRRNVASPEIHQYSMLQPKELGTMANGSPSQRHEGIGVIFGYPIKHSLSPLLHDTGFKVMGLAWQYSILESKDINEFLTLLKDPRCYGKISKFNS